MADILFPRGAFDSANLTAPAQGQTDTRYLINNTVISDGFVWRCRVDNPTAAPSDTNTTEWEKRSAINVQVWANDDTTAIPAGKLGNAGSAGAGFLFGDDAPFTFSTTQDTFSRQTFTGITIVGSSTYVVLENTGDGANTTQDEFEQLRQILIGGRTSGSLAQSHTFNLTPSGTSINIPAGTFISTGQTAGGRGAVDFVFVGTNPFTTANIANQTGFIHIGAQTRVHTLVADRGITGVVNGDILEINANVPDNAVTSISPEIEVTYTSSDDSLVSSAIVSMIMSDDNAAARFRDHFGRETQFGSVNVHETTTLVIDPATGADTNFNLVVGDEIRLTGLEGNDRITIDFTDTPGQTTDDAPQRAQDFVDALGASDGRITIAANTRVIHSIANGTNTEIRRLTDENNILTSGIAVDLDIEQADGEDATDGQMAVYSGTLSRWVANAPIRSSFHSVATENDRLALRTPQLAVGDLVYERAEDLFFETTAVSSNSSGTFARLDKTRTVVLSNTAQPVNSGDLVRGFTSTGAVATNVYLATTDRHQINPSTDNRLMASSDVPTGWIHLTASSTGGSTTLAGLTDVTITNPADDQFLRYDGTRWVNEAVAPGGSDSNPGVPNFTDTATGEYGIRRFEARQLEITIPDSAFIPASGTTINFDVGIGTVDGGNLARTGTLIANSPQSLRAGIAGNSGFDSFANVTADVSGDVITITGPAGTYRIRMNAANTIDFDEFAVNLGTTAVVASGSTTEFTVTTTQAELDASTTWQEITTDTPFWNSRPGYALGNEVIDDNRLFKCNNPVTASTPATQHITSSEIQYISTPIDNADNLLRFTFNQDETVVSGTYRYRFIDNDGNILTGSFPHTAIEDDSGNTLNAGMSSNRWLINYNSITQTGTNRLPTAFTEFTTPDGDIQNGTAANTHPAVTPEHWEEIAPVTDTRILNHSQLSAYEPGQIVTDPVTTVLFRNIDGVSEATGSGTNFTNIRNARIVDDQGTISLAIRFFDNVSPRNPDDSTDDDYPWTLHANIHSDGSEVTAMFTAGDVVDDTTGSQVLTTAANEWLIRVDEDLVTTGNFPRRISNNDSIDFLDVSHASLHSGSFNPRPGADNEHWERIGDDLPVAPNFEGRAELVTSFPTSTTGPNIDNFVTLGSPAGTVDNANLTRIDASGTTTLLSTGLLTVVTNNIIGDIVFAVSSELTSTDPADYTTIAPGAAFPASGTLLFNPNTNNVADGIFTATSPVHLVLANEANANNNFLLRIDTGNRRLLGSAPNQFYAIGFAVAAMGSVTTFGTAGLGDDFTVIYGEESLLYTTNARLGPRRGWVPVVENTSGDSFYWEGLVTGVVSNRILLDTLATATQAGANLTNSTLDWSEVVSETGVTESDGTITLPEGRYEVSLDMTLEFASAAGAGGGNRVSAWIDIQRGTGTTWNTVARCGGYVRGSDERPGTAIGIRKSVVIDTANPSIRAILYRIGGDALNIDITDLANSLIIRSV